MVASASATAQTQSFPVAKSDLYRTIDGVIRANRQPYDLLRRKTAIGTRTFDALQHELESLAPMTREGGPPPRRDQFVIMGVEVVHNDLVPDGEMWVLDGPRLLSKIVYEWPEVPGMGTPRRVLDLG